MFANRLLVLSRQARFLPLTINPYVIASWSFYLHHSIFVPHKFIFRCHPISLLHTRSHARTYVHPRNTHTQYPSLYSHSPLHPSSQNVGNNCCVDYNEFIINNDSNQRHGCKITCCLPVSRARSRSGPRNFCFLRLFRAVPGSGRFQLTN